MSRQAGRWQLPGGLAEHRLDSLHRLGGHHGGGRPLAHLVGRLQGGGEVHQPLYLDALAGAHVADVVEITGGGDQFRPAIRVPRTQKNRKFMRIGKSMSRAAIQGTE